MIRRVVVGALVMATGLFVLQTTSLGSYSSTLYQKVRGTFKKQVPLEFEIERVHNEVAQLVPDMKKNLSIIAEETVAVQNLRDEVADIRVNLHEQKGRILTMTRDLESGTEKIVYDGREFSASRISEKLSRDLASYQRCEKEMKTREQLLEAKERSLETAREQLAAMRDQKRELELQVAQLDTEIKTVRLQQTKSKFDLDDSRLAQIKGTMADIRNRLRVERTTADLHGEFANDFIPVDKKLKSTTEVTKEVHQYFKGETPNGAKLAGTK